MTEPLVSIIIPCYNAERWLPATLESALAQAWTAREIILIDDGSTDGSLAAAEKFEARGVQVVSQTNRGASAARNHGLRLARGQYIQYLDADDLLSPDKIAAQVAWLRDRPAGTVATCAWGRFEQDPAAARFIDEAVFRDFDAVDFLVLAGNTGAMIHPSCWLLPRAVAERAGPWDEALSLNDDGEYFARAALAAKTMAYCPGGKSYYRSGLAGSLSQQRSERARRSQYRSLELIVTALLARETTARTRQAAANYFQRFIHDFFPFPQDLMQAAQARVSELGGASVARPPMGPRTAALAAFLGWRNVWRLKHWWQQ